MSFRCWVIWFVLLCFGWSGAAAEPQSCLQVVTLKQRRPHSEKCESEHYTDIHCLDFRFVPRHADELHLETDDPVLMLKQSEDLWCQGYNMRTGATGIFPAFYAVKVAKDVNQGMLQKQNCKKEKYLTTLTFYKVYFFIFLFSSEKWLDREVSGAVFGLSPSPHPQRQ